MKLTQETIQATRQWYADALAGKYDHSFAFWQKAVFIQTGESVPLFLKPQTA